MKHPPLTKPTIFNLETTRFISLSDLDINKSELLIDVSDNSIESQYLPYVCLVKTRNNIRVGGRFFPSVKLNSRNNQNRETVTVILAYEHEDYNITKATVVHEFAHFKSYICECNHVPSKRKDIIRCRYKGEHDKDFYKILEPMYRIAGIPTYAARIVEGSYNYPRSWNRDNWY